MLSRAVGYPARGNVRESIGARATDNETDFQGIHRMLQVLFRLSRRPARSRAADSGEFRRER